MTVATTSQLRGFHAAFRTLLGRLDENSGHVVEEMVALEVAEEIGALAANGDGLGLPAIDFESYYAHQQGGNHYYRRHALRSLVTRLLGRIDSALEDREVERPTETMETFDFIKDDGIRAIVQRDFRELQRAAFANCFKAQLVLAAGCIEGILYDRLSQNRLRLGEIMSQPLKREIDVWTLGELVQACVKLQLVEPGIEVLIPGLKDYRNLIHPAVEVRERLTPGRHEAEIAVQILHMLRRGLG
jgi:hypothetical protein